MMEKEALKLIFEYRDRIAAAKKMRCTCSSFALQYEGSCQCGKGKAVIKAQDDFEALLDSISTNAPSD